MATRETMKTTPAAADPAIRGSCSLSSDLKSSAGENNERWADQEGLRLTLRWAALTDTERGRDALMDKRTEGRTDRLTV